jgi:hypothetical protein
MRSTLTVTTGLFLLLSAGATAADPTVLAETGGFLLGNAHRCGVPTRRVERAGKVIHDFIVGVAADSSEVADADSRFAKIFLASDLPDQDPNAFPSCTVVLQKFDMLEQHHQEVSRNHGNSAVGAGF